MSVAWTTLFIIVLLLPGVFFFIGFTAHERYSREIVRSSAASDVGLAVIFALLLHMLAWAFLHHFFGFNLAFALKPFGDFEQIPRSILIDQVVDRLPFLLGYVVATALVGLGAGWCAAWLIVFGLFRFLATHQWAYDIIRGARGSDKAVTAFVMTSTVENNRVLMYKGRLQEFYLNSEGQFSYVVLRNCSRYYMKFEGDSPTTGEQLPLFSPEAQPKRTWNYLIISGDKIANILFDPTPDIQQSPKGLQALDEALQNRPRKVLLGPPNQWIG